MSRQAERIRDGGRGNEVTGLEDAETAAGLRFRADLGGGFWLLSQGERDGGCDEVEGFLLPAGGLGEDGTTAVVSFLPFTTAIAATHLFASNLSLHEVTVSSSAEHVATVLFGLNLTVAALMLYLMLRHAGRTPGIAANDLAEEELQAFATQRRSAMLLQASATIVGAFLPLLAVVFYLALAIFYIIDPVRLMRTHGRGRARIKGMSAEN
jgi:hypothetical protein